MFPSVALWLNMSILNLSSTEWFVRWGQCYCEEVALGGPVIIVLTIGSKVRGLKHGRER
jgi:hypothetical protein